VLGSVLLEACVVGLIASLAGLAAGVGVAIALKELLNSLGLEIPAGGIVLKNSTVIVSVIAGLGVSVASAVLPARKAAKVPPIAAMRDVAVDSSGSSRRRMVIGSAVGALGAFSMGAALFGGAGVGPLALGAPLVFVGVAILGPVLARPLSRVLGAPVSLVLCDLDHFKQVNDRFGHAAGDAVLQDVAYAMRATLRAGDSIYRVGGEEILVVLPGAGHEDAVEIAEKLRVAVRERRPVGVPVSLSIGVAVAEPGPVDTEGMLARADAALYAAKAGGRDLVYADAIDDLGFEAQVVSVEGAGIPLRN